MKLQDVKMRFGKTFGDLMLIGEAKEIFSYENGKRTNNLEAIGYPVISSKTWDKFTIKVKEGEPSIEFHSKPIPVILSNVEARLWQDFRSNEIKVSVTADSIASATQSRMKMNKGGE